jgi:glycosyltransferase involved in cell wall biosynthesis
VSRVFVDVTQLVHLRGNMTGIPRVMNELAIRFRQNDPSAAFVVWVKELQAMCEIDLDKTLARRGEGIEFLRKGEKVKKRGSVGLIPSSAALPASISKGTLKRAAIKIFKKVISQTARIDNRLAIRLETRVRHLRMSKYKRAQFHGGDTLFIPWGEWWDSNFTECLIRHHNNDSLRLVQIIHDVGPTAQPQFFEEVAVSPEAYNSRILPIADLVLANSKNTKVELTSWLQRNKLHVPRIRVFRLGDDIAISEPKKPTDDTFKRSGLKGGDFLLMVGTIEVKKNHMLLYYVYKLARVRGITLPKLVIAGRRGWMSDAAFTLMTKDADVKDSFVFQLDKPDEVLAWLYGNCLFTILPSLYEGWGIPIAESVARGVPCLASNFGSMNEVAEGFVTRFCPVSTDECLAAIQKMLNPDTLEKARVHVSNYRQFSWDDSFKQVVSYLKEM